MLKTIEQIWRLVCDGDPAGWRELVARYNALVYSVALRLGLSQSDAEDCAQQTWLSLYRRRHAIKDPQRLSAWLIKTTKRRSLRMLKQSRRYHRMTAAAENVESDIMPDDEILALERQAQIEYAMRHLDERCRRLLNALFFSPKDLSYQEIARQLNINPNSLGPVRSRCLKRLKRIMSELGYL